MKFLSEEKMHEVFAPLQQVSASASLQARAERLAQQTVVKPRPRFGLVLAGACAMALLIGVTMLPRKAMGMLDRMARAVDQARTIHMQGFSLRDEKWVVTNETWYEDGNWRMSGPDGVSVYGDGKKWIYHPDQGIALESERRVGEVPEGAEGGFGVAANYANMNRKGFHFSLDYGQPERDGSKTVVPVTVTRQSHDTERDVFLVEKDTDLPLSGESQVLTPRGWEPRMKWVCDYNVPIDHTEFTASFPSGTRILNRNQFTAELKQQLATPIVSAPIDGEMVAIRSAFLNSKGGLFLLWTGRIGGYGYRLSLTDDKGRVYVRTGFGPGVIPTDWMQTKLVYIDRQVVDGAWFVPLEPIVGPVARSFTLQVTRFDMKSDNFGRGTIGGWPGRRPFEPQTMPAFDGMEVDPVLTPVGELRIADLKPASVILPSYVPLFGDAPHTEARAELMAIEARKHYWKLRIDRARLSADPSRAMVPPLTLDGEQIGNVQLVLPGQNLPADSDPKVLRKLEQIELELLAAEYRTSPTGSGSGFEWFELSAVQKALGESKAAEQSLETAERLRPEIKWRPR